MDLKKQLETHLIQIARERDAYLATAGHFFVQEYIRADFSQWGSVEIHTFEVGSKVCENLILNLPSDFKTGKDNLSPILIAAHYDGVPGTPAADDNASGVAVLLELARIFATQPTKYPIRLVAFDMEEAGLLGSKDYVNELVKKKQKLRLMMSLEMLGYCDRNPGTQEYPAPVLKSFYPDTGDFIALIGNLKTLPDLFRLRNSFRKSGTKSEFLPVPNNGKMVADTRRSDHSPFWDAGYRAMMVTDTSFMRNPHYHKPSDKIETLDLDFLTGVCRGLEAGIRKLM
ncbi:putative aminopeptidase [Rivularia sp. PCC 7116]|uniref:M28 family peptidase n=1 Tax=Rivularia sp. PCC 7116 TaxID=373994 RepID=UPI00029F0AEC|nr:M28 family peptidase [Rivularia sp. PCC 7116]AFY53435.1 putative aminopeptidase [Rivularia sp. PCC 7116]